MKRKSYPLMALFLIILLAGCANFQKLTPQQPGLAAGWEGGNLYYALEAQYKERIADESVSDGAKIELSKKAVPLINKFKRVEIAYLDAVLVWCKSGVQPADYATKQAEYNRLIADISAVLGKK